MCVHGSTHASLMLLSVGLVQHHSQFSWKLKAGCKDHIVRILAIAIATSRSNMLSWCDTNWRCGRHCYNMSSICFVIFLAFCDFLASLAISPSQALLNLPLFCSFCGFTRRLAVYQIIVNITWPLCLLPLLSQSATFKATTKAVPLRWVVCVSLCVCSRPVLV